VGARKAGKPGAGFHQVTFGVPKTLAQRVLDTFPKQDSGFVKDSPFSGGEIQVERKRDGSYDFLIIDNGVKLFSVVDDGGRVHLLRRSSEGATFLVLSHNRIIEVFTFWMDPQDQPRFDVMQSMDDQRGRNSLFTGTCRILDLSVPMK